MPNTQMDKNKWALLQTYFESEEKFYEAISNAAIVLARVMKEKGYNGVIFSDDLTHMTGMDKSVLKFWLENIKPKNKSLANVRVKKGSGLKTVKDAK